MVTSGLTLLLRGGVPVRQQARSALMLALAVHAGDVERVRETVEAGRYEE